MFYNIRVKYGFLSQLLLNPFLLLADFSQRIILFRREIPEYIVLSLNLYHRLYLQSHNYIGIKIHLLAVVGCFT